MNEMHRQFRMGSDGITMVEVLVAISLGAVAMAVLFSIFVSGQGVYVQTRAETGANGDARAVLGLLANEIRSAGSDAAEFGIPGQGFVLASADTLHLMSDLNGDRTISVTEPPEDVLYAYNSGQGTLTRDAGAGPVVILDQIDSMTMRYLQDQGQVITPQADGHVDPDLVRAVEIAISVRTPKGSLEKVKGVFTKRNR